MFGTLTTAYLFLGGAGAGTLALVSLVDLVWMKQPFGVTARVSLDEALPAERLMAFTLLAGFVAVVAGVLCLVFDLGRVDRVDVLLANPAPTFLSVGAYVLVALLACGAFLAAVRFAYLPAVPRTVIAVVEGVAVVAGCAAMLYTGLLLQSLGGVAFWQTPLIPVLFVLSSLSCGIAAVLASARFVGPLDLPAEHLVRTLVRVDLALIVAEALCAAALVGLSLASSHPAAAASAESLVTGAQSTLWWIGFVACGLAVPLALEVFATRLPLPSARTMLALAAVFVLVGGFCLRASLVDAGTHRALELQETPSAHTLRLE